MELQFFTTAGCRKNILYNISFFLLWQEKRVYLCRTNLKQSFLP